MNSQLETVLTNYSGPQNTEYTLLQVPITHREYIFLKNLPNIHMAVIMLYRRFNLNEEKVSAILMENKSSVTIERILSPTIATIVLDMRLPRTVWESLRQNENPRNEASRGTDISCKEGVASSALSNETWY